MRPREILELTDAQIENVRTAAARRSEEVRKTLPPSAGGPASASSTGVALKKLADEGKKPSFQYLWATVYAHMKGMTQDRARAMYDRQCAKWDESQKAKGKPAG